MIPSSKSTARPCLQRGIPAADRGQRLSVANEWPASRLMAATAFGPVGAKRAAEGDAADPVEGDAKPTKKQLRFRAVSHSSHRHCLKIESLADPAARRESYGKLSPKSTKARQRGQRMAYRGKRRPARRAESKTGGGELIPPTGDSGENRPKSVCRSVCTFGFRGQEALQCLRAVGLKPDSIVGRMRFYAPYAVPLKGKRPKKAQLPKEVHKVHTD